MVSVRNKVVFGIILITTFVIIVFISINNRSENDNLTYKEDFYNKQIEESESVLGKIFDFVDNQLAFVLNPFSDEIYISAKFQRQEHAVTCEIASLRMALNYLGENVTEDELIEKINFDTRKSKSLGVWGDPNIGFVGDVNGSVFKGTGYGVYEKPIQELASKYRKSAVIKNADLSKVIENINKRNPVIVWGLLSDTEPIYWRTNEGKTIGVYPGEHTRIVIGYSGDISNPSKIIMMDPIYGKISMDKDKFLSDWKKWKIRLS